MTRRSFLTALTATAASLALPKLKGQPTQPRTVPSNDHPPNGKTVAIRAIEVKNPTGKVQCVSIIDTAHPSLRGAYYLAVYPGELHTCIFPVPILVGGVEIKKDDERVSVILNLGKP